MKAALYARFSTDQQSEASIEDQFRQCERLAAAQGIEIAYRFEDRGISGGTADRPGYKALLAVAKAGMFEIIVVEDVSRLWRNRADYGAASADLEDAGINLLTCVGDDTRRDGWGLVLGIKQAIGESYRKEISYRTRRGLEGRALAGQSTGCRTYGYGPGGVIKPEEAHWVRAMFELAAQGSSLRRIANTLTQDGLLNPSGGTVWHPSTVKRILSNPRYKGLKVWGKVEIKRGARNSSKIRRVPRGTPLVTRQDEGQRIVSDELWEKAQKRVDV
jgi:DNA invertase Pin-like site-specific DNA recombinase